MVEFKTIKSEEIQFGNNNFIEVARKEAVAEEGSNEFVAISRGYYAPDGGKRFKKSFAVPLSPEVVDFICTKVKELAGEISVADTAPAEESAAEEAPVEETEAEEAPAEAVEEVSEETTEAEEVVPEEPAAEPVEEASEEETTEAEEPAEDEEEKAE
ncbi:TPA: hypothetical protein H1011_01105 [archaeon]|jgi:hypothetical protein|uniref:Uncharacterized protein n=1 Tax=Candidatus Undinarchaeum marinum TaxID=2756141 RepID=A0A832XHG1_9ARCH|nr:hypothetical protein [Candidatus Undinarchaeum marinum]